MRRGKSTSAAHIAAKKAKRVASEIIFEEPEIPSPLYPPPPPEEKVLIDYKKELTLYFYNAMLNTIVQDWDTNIDDTTDSIPSGNEVICSKPYEPYIDEEEEEELKEEQQRRHSRRYSGHVRTSLTTDPKKSEFNIGSSYDLRKHKKGWKRSMARFKLKKSKSKMSTIRISHLKLDQSSVDSEILRDSWIVKSVRETAEITFENGNRYIGELYRKIMHGTGQFVWVDGTTYTGDFVNGIMTGKGRLEFSDKSVYEGEMYKGRIHGYGNEYKSCNDSFYNGQYFLSSKHGKGTMTFGHNNYYEGPWNMNKREGKGSRHYENGSFYNGNWLDGKRTGYGSVVFQNKDFYEGEWCNGEKHGYGEYVWKAFINNSFCIPVQNKYCGLWDHDFMHGFGLLYFGIEGGARYAGSFYRNIKHGAGIVVCNNGNVIKADPLFINDKSVRQIKGPKLCQSPVESTSTSKDSDDIEAYSVNSCTYINCGNLEPRIFPILPEHILKKTDFAKIKDFVFPCYGFEKSTISKINQYKLIYSNDWKVDCVSMSIDLGSSEEIDLSRIINIVAAKYLFVISNTNNKENMSSIKERYFKDFKAWPCLFKEHFCEDYVFDRFNKYKECENFFLIEDNCIRKAIKYHLRYLLDLYDYYAFVACIQNRPMYKPWLMRICLWQLFMDCKMTLKNISLNEIDEIMADYSTVIVADMHNPFDIIYFWQFLMLIIILAWKFYGNDFINIQTNGILAKAFNKFLEIDIFPNARQHTGCALFQFKDVIPIKAAFEWYKSFGPNFTAYDFLKSSSSLYKNRPPGYFQEIGAKIPLIQNGENSAFISDKIIYRKIESYVINNKNYDYPLVYSHAHGYYLKSLKYLYLLGGRKVLQVLKEICPVIAVQDEYINMNYKLSFLEFYEALLRCTQEKVIEDTKNKTESSLDNRRTIFIHPAPTLKHTHFRIKDGKKYSRKFSSTKTNFM